MDSGFNWISTVVWFSHINLNSVFSRTLTQKSMWLSLNRLTWRLKFSCIYCSRLVSSAVISNKVYVTDWLYFFWGQFLNSPLVVANLLTTSVLSTEQNTVHFRDYETDWLDAVAYGRCNRQEGTRTHFLWPLDSTSRDSILWCAKRRTYIFSSRKPWNDCYLE